tara:strand:+ start:413 stop:607 length:195 start_codon:yes stop_codon:yes gene_type:complete
MTAVRAAALNAVEKNATPTWTRILGGEAPNRIEREIRPLIHIDMPKIIRVQELNGTRRSKPIEG